MSIYTRSLDELQQLLIAAGFTLTRSGDELVLPYPTADGRRHEARISLGERVEIKSALGVTVPPARRPAVDLQVAELNGRTPFPGLRRADDGTVSYVFRQSVNHDGSVDALVVTSALKLVRHVAENLTPVLSAAAGAEVARG